MSERTTANIVAKLRDHAHVVVRCVVSHAELLEAADRLAELDAKCKSTADHLRHLANELRNAGDVALVFMDDEGVGPAPFNLADALWLAAVVLDGELGTAP